MRVTLRWLKLAHARPSGPSASAVGIGLMLKLGLITLVITSTSRAKKLARRIKPRWSAITTTRKGHFTH